MLTPPLSLETIFLTEDYLQPDLWCRKKRKAIRFSSEFTVCLCYLPAMQLLASDLLSLDLAPLYGGDGDTHFKAFLEIECDNLGNVLST